MYDRIFAGTLLLLSGLIAWTAVGFDVPFQYEPLGPKAFPVILSILMALTAGWLLVKPSRNDWHPDRSVLMKLLAGLATMTLYAVLFESAGFIVATFLVGTVFSWLFGEKPWRAAAYSLALSLCGYFLLKDLLQLNVPAGALLGG
ncbi:MAG: tripartite tricarboxylate transporter TctB family protein [Oceanospirillaceae bacterium]|nr:tripartite tricarboxylate transporter TctB family protein [Oceanospirillaceae bacterium]